MFLFPSVMQDLIEEDEMVSDMAIKDNVFRFLKNAVVTSKNFHQSVRKLINIWAIPWLLTFKFLRYWAYSE